MHVVRRPELGTKGLCCERVQSVVSRVYYRRPSTETFVPKDGRQSVYKTPYQWRVTTRNKNVQLPNIGSHRVLFRKFKFNYVASERNCKSICTRNGWKHLRKKRVQRLKIRRFFLSRISPVFGPVIARRRILELIKCKFVNTLFYVWAWPPGCCIHVNVLLTPSFVSKCAIDEHFKYHVKLTR